MESTRTLKLLVRQGASTVFKYSFCKILVERLKQLKEENQIFMENDAMSEIAFAIVEQLLVQVPMRSKPEDVLQIERLIAVAEEFLSMFEDKIPANKKLIYSSTDGPQKPDARSISISEETKRFLLLSGHDLISADILGDYVVRVLNCAHSENFGIVASFADWGWSKRRVLNFGKGSKDSMLKMLESAGVTKELAEILGEKQAALNMLKLKDVPGLLENKDFIALGKSLGEHFEEYQNFELTKLTWEHNYSCSFISDCVPGSVESEYACIDEIRYYLKEFFTSEMTAFVEGL